MENFPPLPGRTNTKKPKGTQKRWRTYKNIAAGVPTPKLDISIIESTFLRNYHHNCLNSIFTEDEHSVSPDPIEFIVEFEEQELKALQDKTSASYKTLQETFSDVAFQLNMNVVIVVGHIELCAEYVSNYPFKKATNGLPTAVFIIGCHSNGYAVDYNQADKYKDLDHYFFGFLNLMHVLHGEIFMCKNPYPNTVDADCRYDGSVEDAKYYLQRLPENNNTPFNQIPYNNEKVRETPPKKIIQCCNARLTKFKSEFMKAMYTRGCLKIDTEVIVKKIRKIFKEDGTLPPSKDLTEDQVVFKMSDGEPCKKGSCTVINPYQALEKNVKQFDDELKVRLIQGKIDNEFYESYNHPIDQEKIVSYLHSLNSSELQDLLYKETRHGLYFFKFFVVNVPLIQKALLNSSLNIARQDSHGNTVIHNILNILSSRDEYYWHDYGHATDILTAKPAYRILRTLYDKQKDIFLKKNNEEISPLYLLFERNILFLFPFFLRFLPPTDYNYSEMLETNSRPNDELSVVDLVSRMFKQTPHIHREKFLSYVLYSKINISSHNEDENIVTKLEEIVYDIPSLTNYLELIYANTESPYLKEYVDHKRMFFTELQINPTKKKRYLTEIQDKRRYAKRMLERHHNRYSNYGSVNSNNSEYDRVSYEYAHYSHIVNYFEKHIQECVALYTKLVTLAAAPASVKEGLVLTKEKIDPLVNEDLKPFEEGYKAISRVKQFFSDVQKYLKKLKTVPEAEKLELLQELNRISKEEETHLNNAGDDAKYRLGMMAATFEGFKRRHSLNVTISNQLGGKATRKQRNARRGRRATRRTNI